MFNLKIILLLNAVEINILYYKIKFNPYINKSADFFSLSTEILGSL